MRTLRCRRPVRNSNRHTVRRCLPRPGAKICLPGGAACKAATGLKTSVKPKMAIASESKPLTRDAEVGLEVSNGRVIPPRLVEELVIDCKVLVGSMMKYLGS